MKGHEGPYNCTEEGEFDIEELPSCESLFLSMSNFYFRSTTFNSRFSFRAFKVLTV